MGNSRVPVHALDWKSKLQLPDVLAWKKKNSDSLGPHPPKYQFVLFHCTSGTTQNSWTTIIYFIHRRIFGILSWTYRNRLETKSNCFKLLFPNPLGLQEPRATLSSPCCPGLMAMAGEDVCCLMRALLTCLAPMVLWPGCGMFVWNIGSSNLESINIVYIILL